MVDRMEKSCDGTAKNALLEQEVFLSVLRTADALTRGLEEILKPHGLSATQYNVLRILRGAGEAGFACREIGDRMISRDPDMTRLLDRMEQRKLITRHRQTEDRRVVCTRVTPSALQVLKDLDGLVTKLHRDQLGHLGSANLKSLVTLLETARRASK